MAKEDRVAPDLTSFVMRKAIEAGKSFDALAQEVGVSSVVLSRVLRGERVMAAERYEKLQTAIGASLSSKQMVKIGKAIADVVSKRKMPHGY